MLSRVHWVEPRLVAEITYLTWTADNLLRHTVYVGLREDKSSRPGATGELGGWLRVKEGAAYDASQHPQEWRSCGYRELPGLRAQSRRERGRFARDNLRPRDRLQASMQPMAREADRYETRMAYEMTKGRKKAPRRVRGLGAGQKRRSGGAKSSQAHHTSATRTEPHCSPPAGSRRTERPNRTGTRWRELASSPMQVG